MTANEKAYYEAYGMLPKGYVPESDRPSDDELKAKYTDVVSGKISNYQLPRVSPAKLNDGRWGVRSSAKLTAGESVNVVTRAGKAWEADIDEIIAKFKTDDGDVYLASTKAKTYSGERIERHALDC